MLREQRPRADQEGDPDGEPEADFGGGAVVERRQQQPTIEATAITPAARPSKAGRSDAARAPSMNTGIAPSPVASAVAVAARISSSIRPSYRTGWRDPSVAPTDSGPATATDGRSITEALTWR